MSVLARGGAQVCLLSSWRESRHARSKELDKKCPPHLSPRLLQPAPSMDTCPDQANTCLLEFSHLKLKWWRTGNSLLSIYFLNRFLDFRLILWFSITSTRYLVMYLKYLMCKTWQIEIASIILFGLVIFKKSCADACSNPFSLHRMPMVRRWCWGVMLVGTLSQNNNNNA